MVTIGWRVSWDTGVDYRVGCNNQQARADHEQHKQRNQLH